MLQEKKFKFHNTQGEKKKDRSYNEHGEWWEHFCGKMKRGLKKTNLDSIIRGQTGDIAEVILQGGQIIGFGRPQPGSCGGATT